ILDAAREIFHRVRDGDDAADTGRADVKRRVQKLGERPKLLQPCAPAEPMHAWSADNKLDITACFMNQGGGFECALARANHRHPLAGEPADAFLVGNMSCELGREIV